MLRAHHVACRKAGLQPQQRTATSSSIVLLRSSSWNLHIDASAARFLTTAMPKEEEGVVSSSTDTPTPDWRKVSSQASPTPNTSSNNNNLSSRSTNSTAGGSVIEFFNQRRGNNASPNFPQDRQHPIGGGGSPPPGAMGNFNPPPQKQSFGGPPSSFQGHSNSFGRQQQQQQRPSRDQRSPAPPFGQGNQNNRGAPNHNMRQNGQSWEANAPSVRNLNNAQHPWNQQQQQPLSNPFYPNPANQFSNNMNYQRGSSAASADSNKNYNTTNISRFAPPPSRQQEQFLHHNQRPQHPNQPPLTHPGRPTEEFLSLLKNSPPPQYNPSSLRPPPPQQQQQKPATDPSWASTATSSFRASMGQQQQQPQQQPATISNTLSFGRSSHTIERSQPASMHPNPRLTQNPPSAATPWSTTELGNILSSLPKATPVGFHSFSDSSQTRLQSQSSASPAMPPQYDVSDLRAALLNALEQNKIRKREMERAAEQASQRHSQVEAVPMDKIESRPAWRNDEEYSRNLSAQYRKRHEQQEMAREEARAIARRHRQSMDSGGSRHQSKGSASQRQQQQQSKQLAPGSVVQLPDRSMDVNELSQFFQVKVVRLTTILKSLGENPEGSSSFKVDLDVMELVAMELGYQPVRPARRRGRVMETDDRETLLQRRAFSEAAETSELYQSFPSRPPVVCIMGHVDHGKTTLMDSLRRRSRQAMAAAAAEASKTNANNNSGKGKKDSTTKGDVAGTEAGGITQAISAFQIKLESDPSTAVTFLDTPGHAAFRAMRESGSQAADVMVLVIAADDGVSKQTVEIINFYKSLVKEVGPSGISLVIALNKIDKDGIDVEESKARIMNQLLEHDIVTEDVGYSGESEYGPPVQLVPVSGLTGQGLDDLIESLALQSEIMDLRADVEARAEGLVMEASVDQGLGVTAHCVVRWGSLQRGDVVVSGTCWGKVKVLKDVHDAALDKALPSQPVQIVGFSSLPKAGEPFICVASEEMAKRLTERRKTMQITKTQEAASPDVKYVGPVVPEADVGRRRVKKGPQPSQVDLPEEDDTIRIPIMVKADTDATLAAVRESLEALVEESSHDIVLDWVDVGVGPITSAEVRVAKQAGATIFTFGLGKRKNDIKKILDIERVEARDHSIIYALMDDAKKAIAKYLPPIVEDVVHGKARVQALFDIKGSHVAGLKIMDGKMFKEKTTLQGTSLPCHYRVLRGGTLVTPEEERLKAASLKIIKDDVVEVKKGDECGLVLEDFDDIQVDDVIECYSTRVNHVFT